uniref:Mycoplasma haemagglutinin n=1 Tax=Panagrellus redivivus TaxID=6233 RepID=A0A7E4VJZ2_PANRE
MAFSGTLVFASHPVVDDLPSTSQVTTIIQPEPINNTMFTSFQSAFTNNVNSALETVQRLSYSVKPVNTLKKKCMASNTNNDYAHGYRWL